MKGFLSVYKRELRGYFSTPLAYVFLVIFLFFSAFMTFQDGFYEMRQANLRVFFSNMPLLFIFLCPAIAMRLWAEERRTNTIELLFSLPLTLKQAVLGKFMAAWTVVAIALALTAPMVFTVAYLGSPDWGPILTGYLGSLLLAGTYLAIGGFFSGVTRNQVIAFVEAVSACAGFLYASSPSALDFLARYLPIRTVEIVEGLSIQNRFESLLRGVVEVRDITFFLCLIAGWVAANTLILQERKAAG